MLDVGIVGLGPFWESRYRPALLALKRRVRVRSLLVPVQILAGVVSQEFHCEVAPSLTALATHPQIRALLVLDQGWYGSVPASIAAQHGKAVFWGVSAVESTDWTRFPDVGSQTIMPELPLRYTPSNQRLRELAATRVGAPLRVTIEATGYLDDPAELLGHVTVAGLIDWCHTLSSTTFERVTAQRVADGLSMTIEFQRSVRGGTPPVAILNVRPPPGDDCEQAGEHSRSRSGIEWREAVVDCAAGRVVLESPERLRWEASGETRTENLGSERPDMEVMLDHFARRVLGGLVPVPTVEDLTGALRIGRLAAEALG